MPHFVRCTQQGPRAEGICKETSVKENAWASEKRADGNQQYHANAILAVWYAVSPGRREGGGDPVQITGAGRDPGWYVTCVFIFLGSVICSTN